MRVYIGPYPDNHWRCRDFFEDMIARRHGREWGWQVDEKDYDRVDRAIDKFSDFWQGVLNATVNRLVRYRRRKIKVRIDRHDTWGMDTTLGYIILPMLRQLKATKHGSPWVEDVDVPHLVKNKKTKRAEKSSPNVRALDLDEEDQHSDVHERWDWVLDEMIWTFEQVVSNDEGRSNYYVPYEDGEEVQRAYFTRSNGDRHYLLTEEEKRKMGRYDPVLHRAYQERINRGLILFGKYYQSLWD